MKWKYLPKNKSNSLQLVLSQTNLQGNYILSYWKLLRQVIWSVIMQQFENLSKKVIFKKIEI